MRTKKRVGSFSGKGFLRDTYLRPYHQNESGGEIRLVTTRADFLELEHVWHELSEKCRRPNPFISFEWMMTWWDCLGDGKQLVIFVLRSSDKIIGIVPLMRVRKSLLNFAYDEVSLLSSTENPYSPRAFAGTLDFLIPDEFTGECERFIRYLLTSFKGWNYLRLHPLPEDSPALAIFRKIAAESGGDITVAKVFDNAGISLAGTWAEYNAGLSHKLRKNISHGYRKLEGNHLAEFVEYRRPEEMNQAISDILAIEEKSWKDKEGVSIRDPRNRGFYFSLARKFSERNMTRLWLLKMDGVPVAYDLHIQYGKCIKILKGSFREDYAAFSPGTLLTYKALERFFGEGVQHIDLLFGNIEYKKRWTNVMEPHYGVYLKRGDPYTRLIDLCLKSPAVLTLRQKYGRIARQLRKGRAA